MWRVNSTLVSLPSIGADICYAIYMSNTDQDWSGNAVLVDPAIPGMVNKGIVIMTDEGRQHGWPMEEADSLFLYFYEEPAGETLTWLQANATGIE